MHCISKQSFQNYPIVHIDIVPLNNIKVNIRRKKYYDSTSEEEYTSSEESNDELDYVQDTISLGDQISNVINAQLIPIELSKFPIIYGIVIKINDILIVKIGYTEVFYDIDVKQNHFYKLLSTLRSQYRQVELINIIFIIEKIDKKDELEFLLVLDGYKIRYKILNKFVKLWYRKNVCKKYFEFSSDIVDICKNKFNQLMLNNKRHGYYRSELSI